MDSTLGKGVIFATKVQPLMTSRYRNCILKPIRAHWSFKTVTIRTSLWLLHLWRAWLRNAETRQNPFGTKRQRRRRIKTQSLTSLLRRSCRPACISAPRWKDHSRRLSKSTSHKSQWPWFNWIHRTIRRSPLDPHRWRVLLSFKVARAASSSREEEIPFLKSTGPLTLSSYWLRAKGQKAYQTCLKTFSSSTTQQVHSSKACSPQSKSRS